MTRDEAKNRLIEYGLTADEAEQLIKDAERTCEPMRHIREDGLMRWSAMFDPQAETWDVWGSLIDQYPDTELM